MRQNYISKDKRELLNSVLNDNVEDEGKFVQNEILDFLEEFKCRTMLTKENVKNLLWCCVGQYIFGLPER